MNKLKKQIFTALVIATLLFRNVAYVAALDAPSAPTAPDAPTVPTNTSEPPLTPTAPDAPDVPTQEEVFDNTESQQEEIPINESQDDGENNNSEEKGSAAPSTSASSQTQESSSQPATSSDAVNTGSVDSDDVGPSITTGTASNTGAIVVSGNSNVSAGVAPSGSASVSNSGNGSDSSNSSSASLSDSSTTQQGNSAQVANNLNQSATTGDNKASENYGGASIETGEANTTGTIVTAVNTNVDGVAVSEFNIVDNHTGDIILDFGANCISGCGLPGQLFASNTNNGADSTNTASTLSDSQDQTFQNNDADVSNNMTLSSDSGGNRANDNIGGDTSITTEDANVSANVLTFANNNISGNVIYGVVNIMGDLVGDIILPLDALTSCFSCQVGDVNATNNGNLEDSTNTANVSSTNNNQEFQTNDATIENNLLLSATTGDNSTSGNIGGNSSIETGDSNVDVNTLNVANSNIDGGNWWLVIVNEAGKWVGKILGAPEGANFAGSSGSEFVVNQNGEITATNSGNGEGSTNTSSASQTTNNTTAQSNNAHIANNLDLTANTGNNTANRNGGGDTAIETGDAKIVANLVNFVNNNITGGGKLIVTVVNVFGSWIGDFVTPGQKKEEEVTPEQLATQKGGMGGSESSSNNSNNSNDSNNQSSNSNSSNNEASSEKTTSTNSPQASNVSNSTSNKNNGIAAVAGASDINSNSESDIVALADPLTQGSKKKNVTVNLAWFLIAFPILIALVIIKKKNILSFKLFRLRKTASV